MRFNIEFGAKEPRTAIAYGRQDLQWLCKNHRYRPCLRRLMRTDATVQENSEDRDAQ